ncbi:MAG: ABC transporter ATP-binding protein, partial [Marinilabiliaceae bacterium]
RKIREDLGGIYEFLEKKRMENLQELEQVSPKNNKKTKTQATQPEVKVSFAERKELNKNIKKAENALTVAEKTVSQLETELEDLSQKLENPENSTDHSIFEKYQRKQKELENKMEEWEKAHTELESLEKKRNEIDQ